MLKFIKMKQHDGYLLYYSVLFVVVVVLTVVLNRQNSQYQRVVTQSDSFYLLISR